MKEKFVKLLVQTQQAKENNNNFFEILLYLYNNLIKFKFIYYLINLFICLLYC
jgi:hypothetical protein